MSERRIDFVGRLDGRTDLGDGSVRFAARLTRTGVFDYGDHKELRTPEEVFKSDALSSFKGLSVTDGHRAWLDAGNWKEFSIGHVGDDVHADGDFVVASVIVKDADALAKIDSGDLIEISMGYAVDLEHAPGKTADGQAYDSIQRNIAGNHAALGPKDWGRAGGSVRLLDGAAYAPDNMADQVKRIDAPSSTDAADLAAARAENEAIRKERDTARADLAAATKRADTSEAERDAARKEATEAKAAAEKERTDAATKTDAAIDARVSLVDSARGILGKDFVFAGKSDKDVRVAALTKIDPAAKFDGKSEDYIAASFDIAVKTVQSDRAELGKVNETATGAAATAPTKSKLDEAHDKAEADRVAASKAGPPPGALTRK